MPDDNPTSVEIIAAVSEGATRAALDKLIAPVGSFLATLLGPTAEELGGWFGDAVGYLRWKSRIKMLTRAKELIEASGLEPHEVPLQVLVPILDSGANEERPEMQERWAYLLANAATRTDTVPAAFPEILRQLEPIEAVAVEFMVVEANGWTGTDRLLGKAVPGLDNGNIDNLVRLALARFLRDDYTDRGAQLTHPEPTLTTTALAMRFVAACSAPRGPS